MSTKAFMELVRQALLERFPSSVMVEWDDDSEEHPELAVRWTGGEEFILLCDEP